MNAELDSVTMLAMRICAARHDHSCDGASFVGLVRDFARTVVSEFKAQSIELEKLDRVLDGNHTGAGGAASSADHPSRAAASDARAAPSDSVPPAAERAPAPRSRKRGGQATGGAAVPPKNRRGPVAHFTPDERAAIQRDAEAARVANGGALPRGWIAAKARELSVSAPTINRALNDGARAGGDVAHDPSQREHVHSSSCWCRKGVNNATNPWCGNAPRSQTPVTLADPRATMGRPARERPRN